MSRSTLPLRLTQKSGEPPVLMLGDINITPFVRNDGLTIGYAAEDYAGLSLPTVTIVFGPGALELDFDVDLLEQLLTDAKAKAAG